MRTENMLVDIKSSIKQNILNRKDELRDIIKQERERKYPNNLQEKYDALFQWRGDLIEMYADSIVMDTQEAVKHVAKWGREVSEFLVEIDMPLDLAIDEIRYYRNFIGGMIRDIAENEGMGLKEFYELISSYDSVVDHAVQIISVSYMQKHKSNLHAAKAEIDELSVPIIQVSHDVGVLPLVGDLDTERARLLMDTVLSESSKKGYSYLIIDLSGVPVIDTMVSNQIFKVISALKLLGVETKLSGIRPEIAHTMVNLGISFKDTLSFSSLYQALEYIGFKYN
ncbi:STAS domain-containing protein [Pseudalkalibacillus caeni]|uniref:STAS domain-containing protein n=1 Tax=Exobacillus caeni TaxID=2574798 RepID=A0A5R9F938_9BACL|nr:STAS domain-containing protein [Pseudalkalibacillus caeni]TLS36215.1 STAS domain-containing protein [Pseudalkalibacillus caeni]